ncbi:Hypothetical predicted protein [Paramuricea clavata]|uniref:glutathione transferase n=1 Tax=Paramuricea clavata TaxID=317549 RepID=A0A7D9E688_PARCT|nr:Hypothetical predicted protein [Paramuricea clavata]
MLKEFYAERYAVCKLYTLYYYLFIIQQGFAPTESFEVAKADMIVDGLDDLMDKLVKYYREKNEETKQKLFKEFYENHLPHALGIFEKLLKSRGGKYFADNKLTYADIIFFSYIEMFENLNKGPSASPILDNYPALKDLTSTVSSNPGIKKWLSERPDTTF